MHADDIKSLIEQNIPDADVQVSGADGVHFEALVISASFEGKSRVQQHQQVYRALGGRMESQEIHALALKTYTPQTWQAANGEPQNPGR